MKTLLATTALSVMLLVSGAAFAGDQSDDDHGNGGEHAHMREAVLSKLPEADATKFRDAMKASRESEKAEFEKIEVLHKELKALLSAEKFNKVAYLAKSSEIGKLEEKIHHQMTEAFVNAVADLPQEERKLFAENMEWHHHGHFENHDQKDGDKKDSDKKDGDKKSDSETNK